MGGGSQRGSLPWNRPGPVGLRGVRPPLPQEGGRDRFWVVWSRPKPPRFVVADALAAAFILNWPVSWPTQPLPHLVSTWHP